MAAANIRAVAEAQLERRAATVELPQGQTVTTCARSRSAPPASTRPAAGPPIPSSVLMCAIPAQVAGVERVALASPPGPDGRAAPAGARRRGALRGRGDLRDGRRPGDLRPRLRDRDDRRRSTSSPAPATPGSGRRSGPVYGQVGIDSLAGPSELMVIAGHDTDPEWAALDLCAQAEHGPESPLVARRRVEEHVLDAIAAAAEAAAAVAARASPTRRWRWSRCPTSRRRSTSPTPSRPSTSSCWRTDAALLADRVTTAGCVFVGRHGATAFGDYVAGSNHVLPTGGAGRFAGPLGPGAFRRRISTVELDRGRRGRAGAARRRPRPRRGLPRPRRVGDD